MNKKLSSRQSMDIERIKSLIFKMLDDEKIISGFQATAKLKKLFHQYRISEGEIRKALLNPKECLGAFDKLPNDYQKHLQKFADFYLKELNKFATPFIYRLGRGPIFMIGALLIRLGWLHQKTQKTFLGRSFISFGRSVILICNRATERIAEMTTFNIFYKAPLMLWLMRMIKINPSDYVLSYIQQIPVHPYHSPIFMIKNRQIIGCGLIGIDMLPSKGNLYFIEANFNPGHYMDRHLLFKEGDTLCCHLVDFAKEYNYKKILVFPSNFGKAFDKNLESAWIEIAQKKNIHLEILDDPFIGSPYDRVQSRFFNYKADHTLIVNGRFLWGPVGHLVGMKGELDDRINDFNKTVMKDQQIPIPKRLKGKSDLSFADCADNFPNIIVKNKYIDQAKGIGLYKSDQIPDLSADINYIVYEYITPDLITNDHSLKSFVYLFRCYLLLTPFGPVYLGSRKDVSRTPVPEKLEWGKIEDISPYITNLTTGDYCVSHTKEEDDLCRKSVLKIGDLIHKEVVLKHDLEFSIE